MSYLPLYSSPRPLKSPIVVKTSIDEVDSATKSPAKLEKEHKVSV